MIGSITTAQSSCELNIYCVDASSELSGSTRGDSNSAPGVFEHVYCHSSLIQGCSQVITEIEKRFVACGHNKDDIKIKFTALTPISYTVGTMAIPGTDEQYPVMYHVKFGVSIELGATTASTVRTVFTFADMIQEPIIIKLVENGGPIRVRVPWVDDNPRGEVSRGTNPAPANSAPASFTERRKAAQHSAQQHNTQGGTIRGTGLVDNSAAIVADNARTAHSTDNSTGSQSSAHGTHSVRTESAVGNAVDADSGVVPVAGSHDAVVTNDKARDTKFSENFKAVEPQTQESVEGDTTTTTEENTGGNDNTDNTAPAADTDNSLADKTEGADSVNTVDNAKASADNVDNAKPVDGESTDSAGDKDKEETVKRGLPHISPAPYGLKK